MSLEGIQNIPVELGNRRYDISIGQGILSKLAQLPLQIHGSQVLIITDDHVAPLYLKTVIQQLKADHIESLVLPAGESEKNTDNWLRILEKLMIMSASRDACLIALGGGVIGDITGFAAACYMRGIHFIQIPTTLLSQVDASVGGKTAVNHIQGKNLIGAFHQPIQVVIDVDTLQTLADREYRAGLAEVMKYGFIMDANFINHIESQMDQILNKNPEVLIDIIATCCRHKASVVVADETESGIRALLNFGHTFAHAIETATHYKQYLHGEAVAIGCCQAAKLSTMLGLIDHHQAQQIIDITKAAGLPCQVPADINWQQLIELMKLDKKNLSGQFRLILLNHLGDAFIHNKVTEQQLLKFAELPLS